MDGILFKEDARQCPLIQGIADPRGCSGPMLVPIICAYACVIVFACVLLTGYSWGALLPRMSRIRLNKGAP